METCLVDAMMLRSRIAEKLNNITKLILGAKNSSIRDPIDIERAMEDPRYDRCQTFYEVFQTFLAST